MNAFRNASRLRRMIDHESPAWKPSSISFSQSARLSVSGTPHSTSWYSRRIGSLSAQAQRCMLDSSSVTPEGGRCARMKPHPSLEGNARMSQTAIFSPLFATMFLTFAVWVYLYSVRIPFINASKLTPEEIAIPGRLAEISPPSVSNPSDNLKNLFEIPVLFYALALVLYVTKQVDATYVAAAWIFVVFRALHSAVHCTFNLVILRFSLYAISTLAVWFILVRAAIAHFGA